MNLVTINELRASLNLPALTANPKSIAAKKRNESNKNARAQECCDLKAKRSGKGK
jgi:hypothetical protein